MLVLLSLDDVFIIDLLLDFAISFAMFFLILKVMGQIVKLDTVSVKLGRLVDETPLFDN